MTKRTDIKTAALTRHEWSNLTASLDISKRLLYKAALEKLMAQVDD